MEPVEQFEQTPTGIADQDGPATRPSEPMPTGDIKVKGQKRTVCDHCRRRRIRCDGDFPCHQCQNASLHCKREHVPRKRGPKRGHGRVINELRAREAIESQRSSRESSVDLDEATYHGSRSATTSMPSSPVLQDISWHKVTSDPRNAREPKSKFSTEQLRPTSRSYLHLIPLCVELYYEHIYPIMPLVYMPTLRETIGRTMTSSETNFVYALCALTSFHMSGKSIQAPGPPSWETVGRFFLDECIAVRQSYDFLEDMSLSAVISSFYLSTSFFEINQSRKSWFYLREALTLALDLGLQNDATYAGLSPEETLCRQRVFWQLFVTERSFAILRNKPITFKKTPSLPTTRHSYEDPDIHAGFLQLVSSYVPLDESFVTAWNDGTDPRVSASTYLTLQELLAATPAFLLRSRESSPSSTHSDGSQDFASTVGQVAAGSSQPEPTAIQKADLLITQQWLRLIVWQSSFRQGLLSWAAPHESMHFAFPLAIARRTAAVLQSLPSAAVEVHGMGIFEKIFEIGTWCINVLGACDNANAAGTYIGGAGLGLGVGTDGGIMGMDFLGTSAASDLGVLGVGRKTVSIDPLEFFVKTLSASPNSRTQFAERLLLFAGERPGGMRMALSPALSTDSLSGFQTASAPVSTSGSILGEVSDESEGDTGATLKNGMGGTGGGLVSPDSAFFSNMSDLNLDAPLISPLASADPYGPHLFDTAATASGLGLDLPMPTLNAAVDEQEVLKRVTSESALFTIPEETPFSMATSYSDMDLAGLTSAPRSESSFGMPPDIDLSQDFMDAGLEMSFGQGRRGAQHRHQQQQQQHGHGHGAQSRGVVGSWRS